MSKKHIHPTDVVNGYIPDVEFVLESPCEYKGLGFATLKSQQESCIYGVVMNLTLLELWILDLIEWRPVGLYKRSLETCFLMDGTAVQAMIYKTGHPTSGLMASKTYRDKIVTGALDRGLPLDYIRTLEEMPVSHAFTLDHGFSLLHPGKRRRAFEAQLQPLYRLHDNLREKLCHILE